jgi:hypothetical protein
MKRRSRTSLQLAALCLIFIVAGRAYGFEWPMKKAELVSTFGENRHGDFLKGIELLGTGEAVSPVEEGELVFRGSSGRVLPRRLISGLGNMAVLQHERGIRSVYGHLDEQVDSDTVFVEQGGVLGQSGKNAGMTGGGGGRGENFLYLQIIDTEVSRFVNPLLSLPSFKDTTKPVIHNVELNSDTGAAFLTDGITVPGGRYKVVIETYDIRTGIASLKPMAPYSIRLYVNGEERQGFSFESLSVEEGKTVPAGRADLSFQELYTDKWDFMPGEITLQPGEVLLEVVVSDFSGNEAVRDIKLKVTP